MSTLAELVPNLKQPRGDVVGQNSLYQSYILVISYPPSVIDLRSKIVEYFIRNIRVLVQQHL